MSFSADLQRLTAAHSGPAQLAAIAAIADRVAELSRETNVDAPGLRSAVLALGLVARDSNNPKVCAAALSCIASAVEASSSCSGSVRFAVVFDRLGDGNMLVREASARCLLVCNAATSTAAIVERALKRNAFASKNPIARQYLLSTLSKAILVNGAEGIDSNNLIVSHIQHALADSSVGVRDAAVELLVALYQSVGASVRSVLQSLNIRQQQRSAITERFDRLDNGALLAQPCADSERGVTAGTYEETFPTSQTSESPVSQQHLARARTWNTSSSTSWEATLPTLLANLEETGEDWEQPVKALKELRGFLMDDSIALQQRKKLVHCFEEAKEGIKKQLLNLRSAVPREAGMMLALACKVLRGDFSSVAGALLPTLLLQSTVTNKVVCDAMHSCLISMLSFTALDEKSLTQIFKGALGKHTVMRQRCFEFTWILLAPSNACVGHAVDKCIKLVEQVISKGIVGAHEESRMFSRRAFWAFRSRWESRADALLTPLDARQRRNLEQDHAARAKYDAVPRPEAQAALSQPNDNDSRLNGTKPVASKKTPTVKRTHTAPPSNGSGDRAGQGSDRTKSLEPIRVARPEPHTVRRTKQLHMQTSRNPASTDHIDLDALLQACAADDLMGKLEGFAMLQGCLEVKWSRFIWVKTLAACSSAIALNNRQVSMAAFGVVLEAIAKFPSASVSVLTESGIILAVFQTLAAKPQPSADVQRACHRVLTLFVEYSNADESASAVIEIAAADTFATDVRIAAFEFLADMLLDHTVSAVWMSDKRAILKSTLEMLLMQQTSPDLYNAGVLFLRSLDNSYTTAIAEICTIMPLDKHRSLVTLLSETMASHNLVNSLEKREIEEHTVQFSQGTDNFAKTINQRHVLEMEPVQTSDVPTVDRANLRDDGKHSSSTVLQQRPTSSEISSATDITTKKSQVRTNMNSETAKAKFDRQTVRAETIEHTPSANPQSVDDLLRHYVEGSGHNSDLAAMWRNMTRLLGNQPGLQISVAHVEMLLQFSSESCVDESMPIRARTAAAKCVAAIIKRWRTEPVWREACVQRGVSVASALVHVLSSALQPRGAELFVAVYEGLKNFSREAPLAASLDALSFSASCADAPESVKRVAAELIGFAVWEHRDEDRASVEILKFLPTFQPVLIGMASSRRADVRKAALFCLRDITMVVGTDACEPFQNFLSVAAKNMLPIIIQRKLQEEAHRSHQLHDHHAHETHRLAGAA